MKKYKVTITDIITATREVLANSYEEAKDLVEEEYNSGNIELDYENYGDMEYHVELINE